MYYEEQLINGIVHWRGGPNDEFTPYTIQELSERYMRSVQECNDMYTKLQQAEAERA